jgi:ABC-type glutathione transport system ATPase component
MIELIDVYKTFVKNGIFSGGKRGIVKAVDGVSFKIDKGRTFGLVGESGCGKTTLAKLILGILAPDSGKIILDGETDIVFQDPYSSLNPRMKVRDIVGECLYVRGVKKGEIDARVAQTLELVKLGNSAFMDRYPHQFSGGERQRIAIARAIIRRPAVIVLDEPVSSLDVSIQASILNLLKDIQEGLSLTYLFISHDMRVVEFMADDVGVMKDGKVVEIASKEDIYRSPRHEYTKHLLACVPGA